MKLKLLFIALFSTLVLLSCKKEKTSETKPADIKTQLIGTWVVTSSIDTFYDANGKGRNSSNK
jgi:hypothetical protein